MLYEPLFAMNQPLEDEEDEEDDEGGGYRGLDAVFFFYGSIVKCSLYLDDQSRRPYICHRPSDKHVFCKAEHKGLVVVVVLAIALVIDVASTTCRC